VFLAFTVTLHEGHTTLASHEATLKVLKMTSTAAVVDIYTLILISIRLSQSKGSIVKECFMQASL